MIQIRNVPDKVHSVLKSRAAKAGMSLSGYIKKELERIAERVTLHEWLDQARLMKPIKLKPSAAEIIREMRNAASGDGTI